MRKTFSTVLWLIPALVLSLLEALLHLPLLLRHFWEKWRYTALTLREPPPPGGMFGTVVRRPKEKNHQL